MQHTETQTLESLLAAVIADPALSETQRRDRASAIRTLAKAIGMRPRDVELNVKLIRQKMDRVEPLAIGISAARWKNVRTLVSRALEGKAKILPSMQKDRISDQWKALADQLPKSKRLRLSAMLRHFSGLAIEPAKLTLADLLAYGDGIIEHRLRSTPEKTWDGIIWTWNKAVDTISEWPQIVIPREDRRIVYVQPWSSFPNSFRADVEAYLKVMSGETIDEDGPSKALRPATLKSREYQARAAASALVQAGRPAEYIKCLGDVARLEPIKLIIAHVRDRGEGKHADAAHNMARFLKSVAEHWVKVEGEELAKIRKIASRFSHKRRGLTEKNSTRLMPFNDSEILSAFFNLPATLAREVRRDGRRNAVTAITAQIAVAIAILQAAPIRIHNLVNLSLTRHFSEQGGKIYLTIPAKEVKNSRDYMMILPAEVADLLAWYALEYRPILVRSPTDALFPGEGAGPKQAVTLGRQISERVERHLGIAVHPHLFRHIAAKIYLDLRPGEYGTVSRLLNHASVATTLAAYTGAETISAGRFYQGMVESLRSQAHATQR